MSADADVAVYLAATAVPVTAARCPEVLVGLDADVDAADAASVLTAPVALDAAAVLTAGPARLALVVAAAGPARLALVVAAAGPARLALVVAAAGPADRFLDGAADPAEPAS